MKDKFSCFIILSFLVIFMPSCKKDSSSKPKTSTIQVALKPGEEFIYDLGGFGIEEGAGIIQQALHFDSSFVVRQQNSVNIIYTYKPVAGYIGNDQVTLKSERGSNGASPNNQISVTILKFTISK